MMSTDKREWLTVCNVLDDKTAKCVDTLDISEL